MQSDVQSLKRVWQLAGPLKGQMASGILFRFLQGAVLGSCYGLVIGVITSLAEGRAVTALWVGQIAGVMALLLAGQLLFGWLAARASWLSACQVAGQLRHALIDHLRSLPVSFHQSRDKGDTGTALTTDIQALQGLFSDGLPRIAQAIGLPVAVFGVLLVQDLVIGLAAGLSILLAVPVFAASSRRLALLGALRQDRQAEAGSRMIEYVQGMEVIRAFNQQHQGQERYRQAIDSFRDISIRMVVQLSLPMALFAMILMLGVPLVLWVIGLRVEAALLSPGTAITLLVLIMSLYGPLLALTGAMESLRIAEASLGRIERLLAVQPLPEPDRPVIANGFELCFDQVAFGYGTDRPLFGNLDFRLPERSMTAIVGPSGAGKSTILNLICRFRDVDGGRITIGGQDIRLLGSGQLSDLVTVVFQDAWLFSGSIRDNLLLGCGDATDDQLRQAAMAAQAHDFIMALPGGYDTPVGEGGAFLSGGERQRIAIARAILKDAPIVLLDEATAAIDPTNERGVQMALAQLAVGRSLIVVAHKLSTIQAADRILVIDRGGIAEQGDHHSLLAANGLYRQFWQHRAKAAGWQVT